MKGPLMRIYEVLMKDPETLFTGEHTRTVTQQRVGTKSGIGMFAVSMAHCLSCKAQIKEGVVCKNCKSKEIDLYLKRLYQAKSYQEEFAKLWSECQRCHGSLHQEVICSNKDCTIFYRRMKVKKDLKDIDDTLKKFDTEW